MKTPDFTGERFIPGQGGAQIAYEHLHRYRFASRWAAGKKVLDVAAGIGYGAALLADAARCVIAVDLDAASLRFARRAYSRDNLLFLQGDAASLPVGSKAADLAVAMEVLEHVDKQEELVAELARVIAPEGTVLISTPNKSVYTDARSYNNPFHRKEFYRDEFLALLRRHFGSVELVHQQVSAGSLILSENARDAAAEIVAAPVTDLPACEPMYFIALCRNDRNLHDIPHASALLDTGDGLLGEWEQRLKTAGVELDRINGELEKVGAWSREVESNLAARDAAIRDLQEQVEKLSQWGTELRATVAHRDDEIVRLQDELSECTRWARSLEEVEIASRDETIKRMQGEAAEHDKWLGELQTDLATRDRTIAELQDARLRLETEFDERGRWARELDREIAERDARLKGAMVELGRISSRLENIERRRIYRILSRLGVFPA